MRAPESAEGLTPPVVVRVVPALAEWQRFNILFNLRRSRGLIFFSAFWLCVYLSLPVLPLLNPAMPFKPFFLLQCLPVLFLPFFTFVVMPVTIYRAARRRWNEAAELREPRTYTFADDGVKVVGETFATFVAWSHIASAALIAGQAALGTAQQQFHLVPRRAFESDDAWDRFCELVNAKVSGAQLR